jgi:hypothetical protein
MPEGQECLHPNRASGVFQCDLSRRTGEEGSIYSAKLRVSVCESCRHVELYSESHRDLCSWLKSHEAGRSAAG